MKKILGIFDKRPLIWFHYVLLVGVIFLAHYLSTNKLFNLESLTQINPILGWTLLFIWYFLFLGIGDQLIHKILNVD